MKRFTLIPLMVLSCLTPAIGSEAGAIFLLISPGARAGGRGEANVAVADDAYASYWNPAGLGFFTPPIGMNLFLSAYRFNKSMPTLYSATIPFFLVRLFFVIVLTYIPLLFY